MQEVPQAWAAPGVVALPTYLLQLGAPWQLLHHQGKAFREPQLACPNPLPEQHLPVGRHTQHLEAVTVPSLWQPNHLTQQVGQDGETESRPQYQAHSCYRSFHTKTGRILWEAQEPASPTQGCQGELQSPSPAQNPTTQKGRSAVCPALVLCLCKRL